MKKIKLTQGKTAYVDESDSHLVAPFKWSAVRDGKTWYAVANKRLPNGSRTTIRMHHLILPKRKGFITDHKDRNGLNNCRSNLRYATYQQNRVNSSGWGKTSRYKGVYWHKDRKKWAAVCNTKHRGYFDDPLAAALVYDWWAKKLHGEFAQTNF